MATDVKREMTFHICVSPVTMLLLGNLKPGISRSQWIHQQTWDLRNVDVRFLGRFLGRQLALEERIGLDIYTVNMACSSRESKCLSKKDTI